MSTDTNLPTDRPDLGESFDDGIVVASCQHSDEYFAVVTMRPGRFPGYRYGQYPTADVEDPTPYTEDFENILLVTAFAQSLSTLWGGGCNHVTYRTPGVAVGEIVPGCMGCDREDREAVAMNDALAR